MNLPSPARFGRLLRAACVLALVAIGLMVWSLFDPRVVPVMVAMSLGQLFGTVSLATFLLVVALDLKRALALKKKLARSAAEARENPQ